MSFDRVRGQCYDGASAMSGSKSGVSKQISTIEPRAIYTHCYGHALNLAASDSIKKSKVMKDALDTTHEICKLIKFSPRREAIFRKVKESIPSESSAGIGVLCPTRWTVRANALSSVMDNFEVLDQTWEEAVDVVHDSETRARIRGVSSVMCSFKYVFGNLLGECLLKHADNLSSTLQHSSFSAAEGQQVARMTVETIEKMRQSFDAFWTKATQVAHRLGVDDPQLPRYLHEDLMMVCLKVIFIQIQRLTTGRCIRKQLS